MGNFNYSIVSRNTTVPCTHDDITGTEILLHGFAQNALKCAEFSVKFPKFSWTTSPTPFWAKTTNTPKPSTLKPLATPLMANV